MPENKLYCILCGDEVGENFLSYCNECGAILKIYESEELCEDFSILFWAYDEEENKIKYGTTMNTRMFDLKQFIEVMIYLKDQDGGLVYLIQNNLVTTFIETDGEVRGWYYLQPKNNDELRKRGEKCVLSVELNPNLYSKLEVESSCTKIGRLITGELNEEMNKKFITELNEALKNDERWGSKENAFG